MYTRVNSKLEAIKFLIKRLVISRKTHKPLLDNIAWELNNKPRKRLQWHTPQEVYAWLPQNQDKQLDLTQVAFGSRI